MKLKNPTDNAIENERSKLHDFYEEEILVSEQIDEKEVENEQGEEEIRDCPSEPTAATNQAAGTQSTETRKRIPKLAPLCSDRKKDRLNNAKFIDEMSELLLKSTTSSRIGCFVRNIQRQHIQAKRGVKNHISLSLKEKIRLKIK